MYISVVSLSLLSSIFIGLTGKFIGRQAAVFVSILALVVSLILSLIIVYEVLFNNNIIIINLYNLFIINDITIQIGLLFDSLTAVMLLVVTCISSFVHIFTAGYMSHDPYIVRFYSYLGLFTFFMVILVTSDNFLQLFVG